VRSRGADGAAQIIDLMKSEKKARLTHDQFKDKNKAALEELGALARAPSSAVGVQRSRAADAQERAVPG
jgi:hypothetical protein